MRRLGYKFEERYPDYFCWLCEMVCVDGRYTDSSYWILAKILWNTDFYWMIDMDENRAADGEGLRYRYECIGGTDSYDGPCTVLEMMIALADRMDTVMDELDGECRVPMFFWEMIDNLGLSEYTDEWFNEGNDDRGEIDHILEEFLERGYDYYGHGGLFPLKNPREDQREVELWYQANAYLLENYW